MIIRALILGGSCPPGRIRSRVGIILHGRVAPARRCIVVVFGSWPYALATFISAFGIVRGDRPRVESNGSYAADTF